MKNVWKVFEFETHDVLVSKDAEKDAVTFSIRMNFGTVTAAISLQNEEAVNRCFDGQDQASVKIFLDYLLQSVDSNFEEFEPESVTIKHPF